MARLAAAKKRSQFDPKAFLTVINGGRKILAFPKKQAIFVQGDPSDAVFYIQKGKVRLTVVSKTGKEATIGILNEGDFFGESCLTGRPVRLGSATAPLASSLPTAPGRFKVAESSNPQLGKSHERGLNYP